MQIMAVGTEHLLTKFSMDGNILSQMQCAPESAFSVSLHSSGVSSSLPTYSVYMLLFLGFFSRIHIHINLIIMRKIKIVFDLQYA